jgi:hypothetical protein
MPALEAGKTVRVRQGVTVVTRDPAEAEHEGWDAWTGWKQYEADADFAACDLTVERVGVSHATLNGGGRDYLLRCPVTGIDVWARTTMATPETEIFEEVL